MTTETIVFLFKQKMTEILYKKQKYGIHSWKSWVENDTLVTETGRIDGTLKITRKTIASNSLRSGPEQALFRMKSDLTKKLESEWVNSVSKAQGLIQIPKRHKPIKIKDLSKLPYPLYHQYKYDGIYSKMYDFEDQDNKYTMLTRDNNVITNFNDILEEEEDLLIMVPDIGIMLEGELYSETLDPTKYFDHSIVNEKDIGNYKIVKKLRNNRVKIAKPHEEEGIIFDVISGLSRKETLDDKDIQDISEIKCFIFNLIIPGKPFEYTFPILQEYLKDYDYLELAQTRIINSPEEAQALHDDTVSKGYEGSIFRKGDKVWKYKSENDEEYFVIGYESGEGKMDNQVIWICIVDPVYLPHDDLKEAVLELKRDYECNLDSKRKDKPLSLSKKTKYNNIINSYKDKDITSKIDKKYMFAQVPKGTEEVRRSMLDNAQHYKFRWITIVYPTKSKFNKPKFSTTRIGGPGDFRND